MIDYSKIHYNNETDGLDVDLPLLDHPTQGRGEILIDDGTKTPFFWFRANVWVMSQADFDEVAAVSPVRSGDVTARPGKVKALLKGKD